MAHIFTEECLTPMCFHIVPTIMKIGLPFFLELVFHQHIYSASVGELIPDGLTRQGPKGLENFQLD